MPESTLRGILKKKGLLLAEAEKGGNIESRASPKDLGLFLSRKTNMKYLFLFENNNEISFPI